VPTCSVDDCWRPAHARGWCDPHYKLWRRTGSLVPTVVRGGRAGPLAGEHWLGIEGFPGYEVSDLGRVRRQLASGETRLLRATPNKSGHRSVTLRVGGRPRSLLVHRLVLQAFVGDCPPGLESCHADDDPTNNRLTNLRWGTRAENIDDRLRNRGRYKGYRSRVESLVMGSSS
jgi:hypothetical protein